MNAINTICTGLVTLPSMALNMCKCIKEEDLFPTSLLLQSWSKQTNISQFRQTNDIHIYHICTYTCQHWRIPYIYIKQWFPWKAVILGPIHELGTTWICPIFKVVTSFDNFRSFHVQSVKFYTHLEIHQKDSVKIGGDVPLNLKKTFLRHLL